MSNLDMCVEALQRSDEKSRLQRAHRMVAISHFIQPASYVGIDEPLAMMEDAKSAYISGAFLASMASAMSSIEHMLLTEIAERGIKKHKKVAVDSASKAVTCLRDLTTGQEVLLDKVDELNKIRNAYIHPYPEGNPRRRINRADCLGVSAIEVSEKDAFEAIKAMYQVFDLTLSDVSDEEWMKTAGEC
ncbi:hypothetical protein IAE39_004765 [Pseudomonas sp. S37]|uniref:hypothetical protein n=1 Tax=Pseudomonas sp. S37 TaxID=2767449 RepID=UPI0019120496|nr:hypothetical protein [Pseudomonas sp. S37]MBK4996591.1 hypothetical protein [Pseudomonas sp. S37]